jgi:hypothetical protein
MHKLAARWIVFAHGIGRATVSHRPKALLAPARGKLSSISHVARKLR